MLASLKKILLIGGGGHCKSVIDVIELENKFEVAGIIDKKELLDKKILGKSVIGTDHNLEKLRKNYKYAFISIGQIKNPQIRIKLFNLLKQLDYKLPVIISPLAHVSKYAFVDEGTIIMHNVIVNSDAQIGKNCIINTNALIEHDAIIGDNCHISTGAIINGGVKVGKNSFIGSNATTKEYTIIKKNSFIKAGNVVK